MLAPKTDGSPASYFRIRMDNSKLYRRNAVKRNVPYKWSAVDILSTCTDD
jgi:hypothetical protein